MKNIYASVLHDEILSLETPEENAKAWVGCLLIQLKIDGFHGKQSPHEGNPLIHAMDDAFSPLLFVQGLQDSNTSRLSYYLINSHDS